MKKKITELCLNCASAPDLSRGGGWGMGYSDYLSPQCVFYPWNLGVFLASLEADRLTMGKAVPPSKKGEFCHNKGKRI